MNKIIIFIVSIWVFLAPLYPFFIITGMIIGLDTYFGYKLARKEKRLSSRKFSRVIYKFLIYNLIIVTGYTLDYFLLGQFVMIISPVDLTTTKAIVFGVFITELFSIDETLLRINGKGLRFHIKRILGLAKIINKEKKDFS